MISTMLIALGIISATNWLVAAARRISTPPAHPRMLELMPISSAYGDDEPGDQILSVDLRPQIGEVWS